MNFLGDDKISHLTNEVFITTVYHKILKEFNNGRTEVWYLTYAKTMEETMNSTMSATLDGIREFNK